MGKLIITLLVLLVHDDGRYASSPLRSWFDGLASHIGPCCSNADGIALQGPDWDTKDGHYRVRLCIVPQDTPEDWVQCNIKDWFIVPDEAVVEEPNRLGEAIVWPVRRAKGDTGVRCFLSGTEG